MNELFSDVFSVSSENLGASPRDRKRRRTHELPNTTSTAPLLSQRRLMGTMTFHDELEERRVLFLIFFSLLIHHCMVIVKTLTKVRLRVVSNVGDEWESGRSVRSARDSGDRQHAGSSIYCAPRVSRNVGLIVSLQCLFHTYQLDTNFWCFSSPPTCCDSFFEKLALQLFFCEFVCFSS